MSSPTSRQNLKAPSRRRDLLAGVGMNVLALGMVSFFTDVSSEMIYALMPAFVANILGAGAAVLGVIEGIAESTASLLRLASGYLSDRLRKRKLLVNVGYTLSAIARPLMGFAASGWHVLWVRFADRVGKGVRTAPRDALIADSTSPERRGAAFGLQRALDHAGAVAGPAIAFGLMALFIGRGLGDERAVRDVFLIAAIPGALAVATLLLFVREKISKGQPGSAPVRLSIKGFSGTFRMYLVVIVLFTLGNSSDAFLILRATESGVPLKFAPLLLGLLSLVKTLTSLPGGMLSDRFRRRPIIAAGWIVYALIYAGFAFVGTGWQIWALFGAYGIYYGLTEGVEKAYVADLVPAHLRGSAYGLYNLAVSIAALPASVIFGALYQGVSPAAAFLLGAGLSFAACLLLVGLREPEAR